jgi:hypothetical protein
MSHPAATLVLLVLAAAAPCAPLLAAPTSSPTLLGARIFHPAAKPLEEIPVYSLDATAPHALRELEMEIERLERFASTQASGLDNRSFRTRIYQLEKRLSPLARNFDPAAWESLRAAVRDEWLQVQSGLAPTETTATPALPEVAAADPLAGSAPDPALPAESR